DRDGRPRDDADTPARRVRAPASDRRPRGGRCAERERTRPRGGVLGLDAGRAGGLTRNTPFGRWSNGDAARSFPAMQALRDPEAITPRQLQVIRLIAEGLSNEELGQELGISPRTAKAHCDVLRQKLGVPRRRQIPLAYRLLTGDDPLAQSLELAKADNGG